MKTKKTTPKKSAAPAPLYQLKITLKWSEPSIWRRVVVPGDMMLDRLHDVIQIAMGWTDSHLHRFVGASGLFNGVAFQSKDPDFGEPDDDVADESDHTVAELAPRTKSKFVYEYDFGDGWLHDVIVEKILAPDPAFKAPVCLAGENAGPPEDCGGIGGYYEMLRKVADASDPDHEDMKEWLGDTWDATHFDLKRVNTALKRLKK
jgi:Plasmid pRiA4b ORF-3-like protein